jgi:hypothetical protein
MPVCHYLVPVCCACHITAMHVPTLAIAVCALSTFFAKLHHASGML